MCHRGGIIVTVTYAPSSPFCAAEPVRNAALAIVTWKGAAQSTEKHTYTFLHRRPLSPVTETALVKMAAVPVQNAWLHVKSRCSAVSQDLGLASHSQTAPPTAYSACHCLGAFTRGEDSS